MSDPQSAPLYRQISDMLVRRIAAGALIEGERLPPEREMARDCGIAVGTLRRALADLADRGLIERRQGSGNYVRHVRELGGLYGFFRLELAAGGGLPGATVLDLATLPKPEDAPAFGRATRAHRIRRLRRLDAVAAAVEEIWLDADRAPGLAAADMAPHLYQTYQARFGLRIQRIEDRCGVAPLPVWGAEPLGRAPDLPAGYVERLSWAQDGERVEYSRTWFDPDRVRYVSRLT